MSDLFIPDKIKEEKITDLVEKKFYCMADFENACLVYAELDNIFAMRSWEEEPIHIRARPDIVRGLACHKGRLYDGGSYKKVFDTFNDYEVADRYTEIYDLCSYGAYLYDASGSTISNTFMDLKITERWSTIFDLCVHNQELYDAGMYGEVWQTIGDEKILSFESPIYSICSHDREFYFGSRDGVYIYPEMKLVAKRPEGDTNLFSYGNCLYDYGNYEGIFDTISDIKISDRVHNVTAMAVIPRGLLDSYLE